FRQFFDFSAFRFFFEDFFFGHFTFFFEPARFRFFFSAFFGFFAFFFTGAFFLRTGRRHFARDFGGFGDGLRSAATAGGNEADQQAEDDHAHDQDDQTQVAFRLLGRATTARRLVAVVHQSRRILVHLYLYAVGTEVPLCRGTTSRGRGS